MEFWSLGDSQCMYYLDERQRDQIISKIAFKFIGI